MMMIMKSNDEEKNEVDNADKWLALEVVMTTLIMSDKDYDDYEWRPRW